MTISYRASGQSSTTSSGSTLIATVLGGGVGNYLGDATLVFVSCSVAGDVTSITDNAEYNGGGPGNIYTLIASKTNGLYNLYCFLCPSSYQGAGGGGNLDVTAHFSTTGLTASVQVLQYEVRAAVNNDGGTSWVVLDSQNGAAGTANPSTSVATLAAVTTIVAAAIGDNTSTPTNGAGFTARTSGTATGLAFITEDAQETAPGSYTAAVTGAGLTTSTILAVALKEAPAPYAVQGQPGSTQSGNTMTSDAWAFPQTAGNTNLVFVAWYNTTTNIVSVTDVAGNVYELIGSVRSSAGSSIFAYQAPKIPAAPTSNLVSVLFDNSVPPFAELSIVEMLPCVIDPATVSFTIGSANPAPVGPVTTSYANELTFVYVFGGSVPGTAGPFAGLDISVAGTFWGYLYVGPSGSVVSESIPYSPAGQWAMGFFGVAFPPVNTLFFGSD